MAHNFTTGPSELPDVGTLSYNGCTFSPLFESHVSGAAIKDAAGRTVKYMEYTITVDGYVTLPDGADSIGETMATLRGLLTAQGGDLRYSGRGCDIVVNPAGGGGIDDRDVAWGPEPMLLEFQPMGGGLSAKVRWQVKTRFSELLARRGGGGGGGLFTPPGKGPGGFTPPGKGEAAFGGRGGLAAVPLLQFNYETSVGYEEDGFSTLGVRGTLEIPMTRVPTQATRTVPTTADDLRGLVASRVLGGIDPNKFRVTRRRFDVSRDKRTLEWDVQAEERPYMDLPPDCTVARGSYSVRPARSGMGLCTWLCTLRATYTVRNDRPRRTAWGAFLLLVRWRMAQSIRANIPNIVGGNQAPGRALAGNRAMTPVAFGGGGIAAETLLLMRSLLKVQDRPVADARRPWLIDFTADEGLYLDSKTVTFSATWRLVTTFSHILLASGLWTKVSEADARGQNLWATSMRNVQGSQSWLPNRVDPALDVIIDFGS